MFFNKSYSGNRGFSLLELMLVMAILAVLSVGATISFFGYQKQAEVDSVSKMIVDALRDARSRSTSGRDFARWGVYFDSAGNKFILFRDDGLGFSGATIKEENGLPPSVKINSGSLSGGCGEIIFDKLQGGVAQDCAVIIEGSSGGGDSRSVVITKIGKIDRQ